MRKEKYYHVLSERISKANKWPYSIIFHFFILSLTVLSIVFSVNADIVDQYTEVENLKWHNPFSVIKFCENQLSISDEGSSTATVSHSNGENLDQFEFVFVIDNTVSSQRNNLIRERFKENCAQTLSAAFKNDKEILSDEIKVFDSLSIEKQVVFFQLFCLFEKARQFNSYPLITILNYNGNADQEMSLHPISYDKDDPDKRITGVALNQIDKLKILKAIHKAENISCARSNFKVLFNKLSDTYLKEESERKYIVCIASDFIHEEFVNQATSDSSCQSLILDHQSSVLYEDVFAAIDNLSNSTDFIHQLNLVSIPISDKTNGRERILKRINQDFRNSYLYTLDINSLISNSEAKVQGTMSSRVIRELDNLITPVVDQVHPLVLHYPYYDRSGNVMAKGRIGMKKMSNDRCLVSVRCQSSNELPYPIDIRMEDDTLKYYNFGRGRSQVINVSNEQSFALTARLTGEISEGVYLETNFFKSNEDISKQKLGAFGRNRYKLALRRRMPISSVKLLALAAVGLLMSALSFLVIGFSDTLFGEKSKKIAITVPWIISILLFVFLVNRISISLGSYYPIILVFGFVLSLHSLSRWYPNSPKKQPMSSKNAESAI